MRRRTRKQLRGFSGPLSGSRQDRHGQCAVQGGVRGRPPAASGNKKQDSVLLVADSHPRPVVEDGHRMLFDDVAAASKIAVAADADPTIGGPEKSVQRPRLRAHHPVVSLEWNGRGEERSDRVAAHAINVPPAQAHVRDAGPYDDAVRPITIREDAHDRITCGIDLAAAQIVAGLCDERDRSRRDLDPAETASPFTEVVTNVDRSSIGCRYLRTGAESGGEAPPLPSVSGRGDEGAPREHGGTITSGPDEQPYGFAFAGFAGMQVEAVCPCGLLARWLLRAPEIAEGVGGGVVGLNQGPKASVVSSDISHIFGDGLAFARAPDEANDLARRPEQPDVFAGGDAFANSVAQLDVTPVLSRGWCGERDDDEKRNQGAHSRTMDQAAAADQPQCA